MLLRCPQCTQEFSTTDPGPQSCPSCGFLITPADRGAQAGGNGGGARPGPAEGDLAGGGAPGGGAGAPPGAPPGPATSERGPTDWERRSELGLVPAFIATWKKVVLSPDPFFSRVRPDAPWVDALFFGWIVNALGAVLALAFQAIGLRSLSGLEPLREKLKSDPQMLKSIDFLIEHQTGVGVGGLLATIVFYPLAFLIVGGLWHLLCLLFGAAKNGFPATLRAIGYASAPSVGQAVPILGPLFSLYSLGLMLWGIYRLQETTQGKVMAMAAAAVVLLCCCCCGIAALVFSSAAAVLSSAAGS